MTAGHTRFIPHYVVIFLILLAIAGYFYARHRLIQQAELKEEELAYTFEAVPDKQRMTRNVRRWHDSSLIFAALKDFQAENSGSLPDEWVELGVSLDGELLTDFDYVDQDEGGVEVRESFAGADLPAEYDFHIWPGYVCAEGTRDDYQSNPAELAYGQVIENGRSSDFAIVYGAEGFTDAETPDFLPPRYIKCLDSAGGYDQPGFVFRAFKQNGSL
ncbi:hypothetical protein F4X86_04115 [Candidatus Saccharibacteria bacterium]|nr:hypothetical protein [Candidatus Saccharibacteria bacterium]